MHAFGRGSSCCVLLAALLAAALLATANSQDKVDNQPQQQQQQQLQPNIAEVTPYKLTQVPGCAVAEGDGYELPAGLFDECSIHMSPLQQIDPQLFIFSVPDNVQMSAVFTLAVQGGQASISIWYPGTPLVSPPDLIQNELFSSDASSEGWISIPQEDLATHPGDYFISVSSFSGAPAVTLSVATPPSSLQLVAQERDVLAAVAKQCCKGDEEVKDSPFCAAIAKKSLVPEHSWFEDMCHIAPSSCNPKGQLTELALPGMGLNCGNLPAELGQLTALTRLDLSGNNLASATVDDVAKVISTMPDLEELSLTSTGVSGKLSCDVLTPKMKIFDLAYNFIEGPLPACMINNLTEIYLPGNAMSGVLPAPSASSPLTMLYANMQRGGGLTGTIPVALGSLRGLQFLNVGGNSLSGALPGMPRSVKLLNVSDNNLSGRLGSLPSGIWNIDVSSNSMTGALPALAGLSSLEVFVANSNNLEGQIPALPTNLQHFEASGCGLSGPLPALPASIRRFDVADNNLTGSVVNVDLTKMEVFRASNNSLTGGVPASAAVSPGLFLFDLHGNKLTGSVPDDWTAPRMQMIMLEDNALTGTIPASLAALPRLGVLRLGSNKLSGNLEAFATQLTQLPAAASGAVRFSNLFDFNVSSNHLSGPVPDSLSLLGVFNPNITIIVPGDNGGPSIAPRVLDLSDNKLQGDWPIWLLDAVPATASICHCSLFIALDGPNMRLTCPAGDITVSDYAWQLAAEQRYKCWNSTDSVAAQLLDQLTSAANSNDKIDTTSTARGDGGNYPFTHMSADPKIIAGVVIGVVGGLTLLSVLGYFVVYKRVIRPQVKATAFSKFEDDPVAAAAAGSIGLTGVGAHGGAAPHETAAAAAARPM